VDVNGINKMAGEWYHILYHHVYGMRCCALRLTNTYGPRMRIKDARQTFVGLWIRCLLEERAFEVWEGQQLRDFNYVDDCVNALLLAAEREEVLGRVFNLGAPHPVSLQQLAKLLVELNGGGAFELRSFPLERKIIDIGDYYSDFSAYCGAVGWSPQVDLREGMRRTLDYFREHLSHYV
jgi:nucleoside-diphosphate-sugar epimerase